MTTAAERAKQLGVASLVAEQIQDGFENGTFTAEQLTQACLEQIERYNKKYNAIIQGRSLRHQSQDDHPLPPTGIRAGAKFITPTMR